MMTELKEKLAENKTLSRVERERFITMFKAMGNPIRYEMMEYMLKFPGCNTTNIVDHLPIAQATVSQHLKVLKESGLVSGELEGPATCYCLNDENVNWFKETVQRIF